MEPTAADLRSGVDHRTGGCARFCARSLASSQGGSVLLKTTASGQAIISAPAHGEDRYGEQEYLQIAGGLSALRSLSDLRRLHRDDGPSSSQEVAYWRGLSITLYRRGVLTS